ncbi:uracil-DNA glycosylase [Pseudoroseicyclus aestuarii]|uniref:Uracil-DNA glycosylase n=1 Tax=Pseudoroseicyclus aestuarii TaxID=1795041 RepID=A0A318T4C9_9RHOB|nr:uracil-DNA glycosylase [Pseudoroseicyclus aestuarii]PYE81378.1 uracil-DNA glycosylase [Pseudoroseicyclus aestuarii]
MDLPARPAPPGWDGLPFWDTRWPALRAALAAETRVIHPPAPRVFAALAAAPPEAVRVVILGQDPYHTPGKADGLAFSIPRDFPGRLDSLGNIFKEMEADLGTPRSRTDLPDLAAQGVLLLNTALTVPEGAAKGHARLGWDALVRDVLARLSDRPRAYILWGGPAQTFRGQITCPGSLVIESAHPSPLSAYRGFFGSRPFSRVNDWLTTQGEGRIDWTGTLSNPDAAD